MIQPEVIEISTSTFGDREIVSNLTIIMADPSDAGGYICIATNVVGQDTTAADLIVHGKWLIKKKQAKETKKKRTNKQKKNKVNPF